MYKTIGFVVYYALAGIGFATFAGGLARHYEVYAMSIDLLLYAIALVFFLLAALGVA